LGNILLDHTDALIRAKLGNELEEIFVERAVFGLFFSGVKLNNGHGGLCFTPVKELPEAVCCPSSAKAMPLSGKLAGRSALEYLDDLRHDNILRKTLAIATLNALSSTCWDKEKPRGYTMEKGADAFDDFKIPEGGKTVVVGALVPAIRKLIKAEADFTVIEMDRRTLKGKELDHYAPFGDASKYVPSAKFLIITGVTILNDTLPDLLEMARPDARVIVAGPTASMLPDIFFQYGVTVMGGVIATKPDELLDVIGEAGSGYHFFGKSAERLLIKKV
jgi:uncharacterized protein (DUF4213/DUF364 family)